MERIIQASRLTVAAQPLLPIADNRSARTHRLLLLGIFLLGFFTVLAIAGTSRVLGESPAQPTTAVTIGETKNSQDLERQIRDSAELFAKTYNAQDAKGVAALFTSAGEIIDETGHVTQGTAAIEQMFTDCFTTTPEKRIALQINSIRLLNADTAGEEGRLLISGTKDKSIHSIRYSVLHVREGTTWLVASARNYASDEPDSAHEHLRQLEWMVGNWVDEGPDSLVTASCRWDDSGNFLLRDYQIQRAGHTVMSGTQRIGWDALGKQLKSWTFDSEGGSASGHWHHKGDQWILDLTGVSADGKLGTATHVYTNASPHVMKWHAVQRTLGGEPLDDLPEVSIVRAPSSPESREKELNTPAKNSE